MEQPQRGRGRYVIDASGKVALVGAPDRALPVPEGVVVAPCPAMGPTRLGEWLMVDVRAAQAVKKGSRLFEICHDLASRKRAAVIESTLVIDLLEMTKDNRRYLLDQTNWPVPVSANG